MSRTSFSTHTELHRVGGFVFQNVFLKLRFVSHSRTGVKAPAMRRRSMSHGRTDPKSDSKKHRKVSLLPKPSTWSRLCSRRKASIRLCIPLYCRSWFSSRNQTVYFQCPKWDSVKWGARFYLLTNIVMEDGGGGAVPKSCSGRRCFVFYVLVPIYECLYPRGRVCTTFKSSSAAHRFFKHGQPRAARTQTSRFQIDSKAFGE